MKQTAILSIGAAVLLSACAQQPLIEASRVDTAHVHFEFEALAQDADTAQIMGINPIPARNTSKMSNAAMATRPLIGVY